MKPVFTLLCFAVVQCCIAQVVFQPREQRNFRLDITKAVIETLPGQNVFLSPNTILSTIGEACKLSDGNTEIEIQNAIGSCSDIDSILSGQLTNLGPSYHRNSLFFIDPKINPKVKNSPKYRITKLSDNGQNEINEFISHESGEKIKKFYDQAFDPKIGALPVSADTFESFWQYPFHRSNKGPFYSGKSTIEVDYMSNIQVVPYYNGKTFRSIGIPLENSRTNMYIILPDENETVASLSDKLTLKNVEDIFQNSQRTQVNYTVPKLVFKNNDDLTNALSILGIVRSFMPKIANFSGLTDSDINMNKVMYKSIVNMYESGIDAAGATAIEMVTSASEHLPEPPVSRASAAVSTYNENSLPPRQQFEANRPFLFILHDQKESAWLMSGAIYNPQRSNEIQ